MECGTLCLILLASPTPCQKIGGGERVRTDDLLRARQALSQLSYTPDKAPLKDSWWAWMELNHRPHAYQACALTELSYRPRLFWDLNADSGTNQRKHPKSDRADHIGLEQDLILQN